MPRLPRVAPVGIPEHIIQRGNNRHICFNSNSDMKAYANWLKEYSKKYQVEVHAWVFMTNHTHLLCTPQKPDAVSHMMQSLGRMYVGYFNDKYKRSGTLWEGRYKSCLVQNNIYLMQLYRYIELNPVRAGMVSDPADYSWSSYQCNALGKKAALLTPHPLYLAQGNTTEQRQQNYRLLFKEVLGQQFIDTIRKNTNTGLAVGDSQFIAEIERLTGRKVTAKKTGRPTQAKPNQIELPS